MSDAGFCRGDATCAQHVHGLVVAEEVAFLRLCCSDDAVYFFRIDVEFAWFAGGAGAPLLVGMHGMQSLGRALGEGIGRNVVSFQLFHAACDAFHAHKTAHHRFSGVGGNRRDRTRHVQGVSDQRWHEDDDRCIDAGIREHALQRELKIGFVSTGQQIDRIGCAGFRRNAFAQFCLCGFAQGRQLQTEVFAGIGGHDGRAAGIGDHGDAVSCWQRLVGKTHGKIEHLLDRVGADDAALPEHGIIEDVCACQGAGVAGGRTCTAAGAAGLDDDDWFLAADLPRQLDKLLWPAKTLEVHQDHIHRLIVLPVCQDVVAGDIRLVADGDEHGDTEIQTGGVFENGDAQGSALGDKADIARQRDGGSKSAIKTNLGISADHAHAVRANHAHAMLAHDGENVLLAPEPFLADLAKTGGDHDQAADTGLGTLLHYGLHMLTLDCDDRKVHLLRHSADTGICFHRADELCFRVHRKHRAVEIRSQQFFENNPADGSGPCGSTDHSNGPGTEDRIEGLGSGHGILFG